MSPVLAVQLGLDGATATASATFSVAPRFGINYDVDGGILSVASTLRCAPLTAAKVFNSSMPASYPGHPIPASVTHPLATIKIKLTSSAPWISAADQAGLATVFGSMPKTGVPMVTTDQEGEAPRFGYSAAQVAGSHHTAYQVFKAHAPPNAVYVQDEQTYSAHVLGASFGDYLCCAANGYEDLTYLLDWYPTSTTTDAAGSVTPAWDAIKALVPSARIGIAECNYTTNINGGITWTGSQDDWFFDAWGWARDHDCPLFMGYFLTAHGVPWLPPAATITELSEIAQDSGL
jgi:hypothetical protein